MELVGVWVAAAMTLFIFSFLYRDNPLYKLAEHVFVGVSVGYALVFAIWKVIYADVVQEISLERWDLIIPTALGILALTRMLPKLNWLSRPTFAFVMGYTSGVAIPTAVDAFVLKHSASTVSPILQRTAERVDWSTAGVFGAFTSLLVVVIVLCCLVYFFFSIEHRGPVRVAARAGILFLMIAFGIAYGNTVMGRMSLLFGRFFDLKEFSGPEFGYATPILLFLTVLFLVVYEAMRRKHERSGGQAPPA